MQEVGLSHDANHFSSFYVYTAVSIFPISFYVQYTCTCTCTCVCAMGDFLTSRPESCSRPRELWFSIYSCTCTCTCRCTHRHSSLAFPLSLSPLSCGLGSNKELIAGSDAHAEHTSPGLPDCPTQGKGCQMEEVKGIEVDLFPITLVLCVVEDTSSLFCAFSLSYMYMYACLFILCVCVCVCVQ